MPRAQLVLPPAHDAPLTVTAVSSKLGVSASTLRTWERRYGLGPGERSAGSHRRYLPEDVARLSHMIELIQSGVTPADAAAIVLSQSRGDLEEVAPPRTADELVAAARAGDRERLVHLIEASISEKGLLHTWMLLVEPAFEVMATDYHGEIPGVAGSSLLTQALSDVLRAMSEQRPEPKFPSSPSIIILGDRAHLLPAHVIGVALRWYGPNVVVLGACSRGWVGGKEKLDAFVENIDSNVAALITLGQGEECKNFVASAVHNHGIDVIAVGSQSPRVLDDHVLRVRTVSACVEETLALLGAKLARAAARTK